MQGILRKINLFSELQMKVESPNPTELERAVFVEACDEGWNPQTIVRQLVWRGESVCEELVVFPSLREALAYAQRAFVTQDGPMARSA